MSIICTPPGQVPARFWLPFLLCPGWRVPCCAGNPVVSETPAAHGRLQAPSTSHLGPCPRSAETLPFGPVVQLQSYALQALASAVTDTTCQILCWQLDTEEPATACVTWRGRRRDCWNRETAPNPAFGGLPGSPRILPTKGVDQPTREATF